MYLIYIAWRKFYLFIVYLHIDCDLSDVEFFICHIGTQKRLDLEFQNKDGQLNDIKCYLSMRRGANMFYT